MPYFQVIVMKKLIYVMNVAQYLLFFPDLAFCISNLANKHGVIVILAYIPTHLNVEANYRWVPLKPDFLGA